MKEIWNWIQVAFAAIGGTLGWFLGGLDGFLYALIAFVVVDYITGVLRAIVEKKLSSRIGAQGIAKKVATAIIFFYIANVGISIVENATAIGLPVPAKLKDVLAQLHGKDEQK